MPSRRPTTPRPKDQIVEFAAATDEGKERMISEIARLLGDQGLRLSQVEDARIGLFTSIAAGIVPASGGSTTSFLSADGTWKTVVGIGLVDSVTAGSSKVAVSPTTGTVVVDVVPANFTGIPQSGITGLVADLAAKVPTTRTISTTAPLTGGGDLSANRTLAVSTFTSAASGIVPLSGGGTTNFLRADGTWTAVTLAGSDTIFSHGQDGVVTFSSGGTVLGITASSMTWFGTSYSQYTLTRDISVETMTVNSGVAIRTAGYRIFVRGTLTNNGLIHNHGTSTTTSGGGAGGLAGYMGGGTAGGTSSAGTGGATTRGARGICTVSSVGLGGVAPYGNGTNGDVVFRGAGGGADNASPGATSGDITTLTHAATVGSATLLAMIQGKPENFTGTTTWEWGTGGGAGNNTSAGGGGGGAVVVVAATLIGGSYESRGGNGSNSSGGVNGGGGGGGGGLVLLVTGSRTGGTPNVSGGTGGTGTGGGGNGGIGASGLALSVDIIGGGSGGSGSGSFDEYYVLFLAG